MCPPGKTVCKWHGGNSTGAPKGNKNAYKHGVFAKLTKDALFDDEIKYAENIEFDPVATLQEQIRLLKVKELRIARKMKEALVSESEAGKEDKNGKKKPATTLLNVSTVQSQNPDGDTSKSVTSNSETWEMHYLRLDELHTRILNEIRRAMNNLHKLVQERQAETADKLESGVLVTPGMLTEDEWERQAASK